MSQTGLERRGFLKGVGAAGVAAPAILARGAWAQGKSINVGTYTGPQADYIRKNLIPKFEADYGCRVYQSEGSTLGQIGILRTQKANPSYTVMFMDDVGIPIAKAEDLIAPLPAGQMKNVANVFPRFVLNDGYGVAFAVSTAAPFYNTQSAKPLGSYAELWEPRLKGRFMMVTPKQTQGVLLPVVAAALATGKPLQEAQYEVDKGWDKLAELKPNVQTLYEAGVTAVLQVSQGQADFGGLEMSKIVLPYTAKGAPVDLCYPKEGAFGILGCMTLVRNGPNPDLGAAFLDRMLEPAIQTGMAEASYAAPTVKGLSLKPEVGKLLAYPESRIEEMKLATIDWTFINPKRGAMIEKANQIFGVR